MPRFSAMLRTPEDSTPLPVAVDLADDRMVVRSGEHLIGDWPVGEVDIEVDGERIVLAAEGELMMLDVDDVEAFLAASGADYADEEGWQDAAETIPSPDPGSEGVAAATTPSFTEVLSARTVAAVAGILVIAAFLIPGIASAVLLVGGIAVVALAAVGMLDDVFASRILRDRVTPFQALVSGAVVGVVGFLIGLLA